MHWDSHKFDNLADQQPDRSGERVEDHGRGMEAEAEKRCDP